MIYSHSGKQSAVERSKLLIIVTRMNLKKLYAEWKEAEHKTVYTVFT